MFIGKKYETTIKTLTISYIYFQQFDEGEVTLPSTDLDPQGRLSISRNPEGYVIVQSASNCGVELAFDPRNVVVVVVPSRFARDASGLYGLCGDCDGEPDALGNVDDYKVAETDENFNGVLGGK